MDPRAAAERWAATWTEAWGRGDAAGVDAIAALYAPQHTYRSHPHREPEDGGARGYTSRTFAEETGVRCRFGEPVVDGQRAVVEWWATLDEAGERVTLSGATVLRFATDGLVTDHVDYWVASGGHVAPFATWPTNP